MSVLLNYGAIATGIRGIAEIKEVSHYPRKEDHELSIAKTARVCLVALGALDLYYSYVQFQGRSIHPISHFGTAMLRVALFIQCISAEENNQPRFKDRLACTGLTQLFLSVSTTVALPLQWKYPRTSLYISNAFASWDLFVRLVHKTTN